MSTWSLIPLAAFIISTILTTYVYAYQRTQAVYRAYFVLSLFLSSWLFFEFLLAAKIPDEWAVLVLKVEMLAWAPAGFLFLRFVYTLINRQIDYLYRFFSFFLFIAIPIGLFSDLVVSGFNRFVWGVSIIGGPLYQPISDIVITAPFIISFYFMIRKWVETDDATMRMQLMIIGIGSMSAFAFSYTSIIVLPVWFKLDTLELISPSLLFYSLAIFIAIRRRQFLSLSVEDVASDLFKQMPEAVLILGPDKKVLQMNQAAENIFGTTDMRDGEKMVTEFLSDYPSQESFQSFETIIQKSDRRIIVSVSQTEIEGESNRAGKLLIIKDITEEKEAANSILQMNQSLEEAMDQALSASQAKS